MSGSGRSPIGERVHALLPGGERRAAERRERNRRRRAAPIATDRRAGGERRDPRPRRESAVGHLLNAAQLLTLAAADAPAAQELAVEALRRIWLGLREMESANLGWVGRAHRGTR